jgi:hypothetical protein
MLALSLMMLIVIHTWRTATERRRASA